MIVRPRAGRGGLSVDTPQQAAGEEEAAEREWQPGGYDLDIAVSAVSVSCCWGGGGKGSKSWGDPTWLSVGRIWTGAEERGAVQLAAAAAPPASAGFQSHPPIKCQNVALPLH